MEKLDSLSSRYFVHSAANSSGLGKYFRQIRSSKIVVSPWGHGEMTIRDYETLWAGAALIKPRTDFLTTAPDILVEGVTYTPCKPDWSDLEERIEEVLGNWDSNRHMRARARELAQIAWGGEEFASGLLGVTE